MSEKQNFLNKKVNNMADRRKQIDTLYDGSDEGLRRLFNKAAGNSASGRFNEASINQLFNTVGTESMDRDSIRNLSEYAYSTDPTYATIIDYLSDMFLWRYYYMPIQVKKNTSDESYAAAYELMTEVVDGLSLEVIMPTLLSKLFQEGAVYLYTTKNTSSKTISTTTLNPKYCKPVMMSQYGTGVFQFNLKYFDDLGFRGEELEEILEYFPDELVTAYRSFKTGGPQRVILDGRNSTYISENDYGFPKHLNVLKSLFDYNQYRKNEVERNTAQLDRIITHKIPAYENRLLFELPEVKSLHKSMSRSLAANSRTRLLTTFGDVQIHAMQEDSKVSSEQLGKAQEAIYRTAGLNSDFFIGKTKEALEYSLTKDQSTVWKYVQQIMNFYNLTINNLFNFKGYQIELTMLPITHYNLKDMMETHRRNGEYGIGRLEAIVASGTKQRHIAHKSKLEEFLELDTVLTPLKSSHTRSGTEDVEKETVEETDTNPISTSEEEPKAGEE